MADVSISVPSEITDFIIRLKELSKAERDKRTEKKATISKEAQSYQRILVQMERNCDSDVVAGLAKILTVMTGEKITPKAPASLMHKYVVLVPNGNPNGHNYVVGAPVMVYTRDMGFDGTLMFGNHLPTGRKDTRLATEEEIDKFFDALTLTLAVKARHMPADKMVAKLISDAGLTEV